MQRQLLRLVPSNQRLQLGRLKTDGYHCRGSSGFIYSVDWYVGLGSGLGIGIGFYIG